MTDAGLVGGAPPVVPPTNDARSTALGDLVAHVEVVCNSTIPDTVEAFAEEPEPLVYLARVVQVAIEKLKDAYTLIEDALVEALPRPERPGEPDEHFFEGVGTVTRRSGSKRTSWDHESLWADVVPAIIEKIAKGGTQPSDVLPAFIEELRKAVTASWKVTGLRPLGIDPEEYCETSWGRRTIQMPPVDRGEADG